MGTPTRCACGAAPGECKPGKHPWTKRGLKDGTTDEAAIRRWWRERPESNIALVAPDDVIILDIDTPDGHGGGDGQAAMAELQATHGNLPASWRMLTGSGGEHVWLRLPQGVTHGNAEGALAGRGINVRGSGKGYVVVAPSLHECGKHYAWIPGFHPTESTLAEAPAWLVELVKSKKKAPKPAPQTRTAPQGRTTPYGKKALDIECATVVGAPNGEQNNLLNAAAFSIFTLVAGGEIDEHEAQTALEDAARQGGHPEHRALRTIASGRVAGMAHPRSAPERDRPNGHRQDSGAPPWEPAPGEGASYEEPTILQAQDTLPPTPRDGFADAFSDLAAARRFVVSCGADLRYVAAWRSWLVWDGSRWLHDATGEVKRRCARRAREFTVTTARYGSNTDIKAALGFEGSSRINGALDLAAVQTEVSMRSDAFDTHEWLLACPNGTLDLRTGELRASERSDLLTQASPVAYDPAATCPTFDTFISEALPDPDVRVFVQRFLGYCLTGSIREQAMLMAVGGGRNGKGTLFESFARVLGPQFATPAPPGLLMAQKGGERHPTELADLKGRRFVYASEVPRGAAFSEQRVKWLSGGDTLKGRGMHQDFSEFPPTHKLVVYVNDKPRVKDTTDSFWRRMRLVVFPVSFKGREDKNLPAKLQAELPGILAWAVRGSVDWYEHGLPEPAAVTEATADYRTAEDPIARWVEWRVERREPLVGLSDALRSSYNEWARQTGEREVSERAFGDGLKAHGFSNQKTKLGRQWTLSDSIEAVTGSATRHHTSQNATSEVAEII